MVCSLLLDFTLLFWFVLCFTFVSWISPVSSSASVCGSLRSIGINWRLFYNHFNVPCIMFHSLHMHTVVFINPG